MISAWVRHLSTGTRAALLTALVGALCLLLQPLAPWIVTWPDTLALPATDWIGAGLGWVLDLLKPVARAFSSLMAYPMGWANAALVETPWPITIGAVTALGWYIGGWADGLRWALSASRSFCPPATGRKA